MPPFKTDENIPRQVVEALRTASADVETVRDE